jgi:hypothetical protein
MTSQLTGYGLGLLWVGAVALGGLIVLRQRPLPSLPSHRPQPKGEPSEEDLEAQAHYDAVLMVYRRRQVLSLACQFIGLGGVIAGLGLLAVGVMK